MTLKKEGIGLEREVQVESSLFVSDCVPLYLRGGINQYIRSNDKYVG